MKLHAFHFTPHGLVKAFSHLRAGRRLCRATGLKLRPLLLDSVNSMTAAYNVHSTFQHDHLPLPQTIMDIGANVSQMTRLLLGMNRDAKVLSFEPNPALHPLGDVWRIALSDSDGEADFFIPSDDSGWGTIEGRKDSISSNTRHFRVRTNRMDSLIRAGEVPWESLKRPILLKIDTEGSEKRVLDGFGKYLSDVQYALVEVENNEKRGRNYTLMSVSAALAAHGFNQCKIVYACYEGPDAPAYSDILFWKA